MKQKFKVTYVSNGVNKSTQYTNVTAQDQYEARRVVEEKGNKVIAVVYQGLA